MESEKSIEYRKPVEGDIEGMFELWWEMQSEHLAYDPVWYGLRPRPECRQICLDVHRRRLSDPKSVLFVATVDGYLVGMLLGSVNDRPSALNQFKVLAIDSVVVTEKWRRRGILRQLMALATAEAISRDAAAIDLKYVDAANPARHAYEKLGFKCHELAMGKYIKRKAAGAGPYDE